MSVVERPSEPAAAEVASICSVLQLRTQQRAPDDAAPHGEIYSLERLAEHATEVASALGPPSLGPRPWPILEQFEETARAITLDYERLTADARERRDPTPAEEWLLDNRHVVEDQLREIREDLPRGFL